MPAKASATPTLRLLTGPATCAQLLCALPSVAGASSSTPGRQRGLQSVRNHRCELWHHLLEDRRQVPSSQPGEWYELEKTQKLKNSATRGHRKCGAGVAIPGRENPDVTGLTNSISHLDTTEKEVSVTSNAEAAIQNHKQHEQPREHVITKR